MESAPGARPCLLQLSTRESSFHNTSLMKLLLLNKAVITTRIQNFCFSNASGVITHSVSFL